MEKRNLRVVLETDRHRIVGELTLPNEGYRSRLSDYLNQGDLGFVALTNATVIERLESGATDATEHEFVTVGTRHVLIAYPDETGGGSPPIYG
ncbi:MAG: hypothetical protein R2718_05060 [Solirubrobacterales bacterium]|nr:hypothetical protein [Solirubrobacterales bacterium]